MLRRNNAPVPVVPLASRESTWLMGAAKPFSFTLDPAVHLAATPPNW